MSKKLSYLVEDWGKKRLTIISHENYSQLTWSKLNCCSFLFMCYEEFMYLLTKFRMLKKTVGEKIHRTIRYCKQTLKCIIKSCKIWCSWAESMFWHAVGTWSILRWGLRSSREKSINWYCVCHRIIQIRGR